MKAERAKRAERLTAWGPGARLRAPGGVQGQSHGGVQGAAPPEALGFWHLQKAQKGSRGNILFFKSTYICMVNVSIKWHSSLSDCVE